MIKVENLSYEYPGQKALDTVNFQVLSGSITALVGPNGSGKTTLLRCISGLLKPYNGKILIKGSNLWDRPNECKKIIGFLNDFFGLYENLTVFQALKYFGMSYRISSETLSSSIPDLLEKLNLKDKINSKISSLSRGMKQRVAIGQAIIHNPEILILDEPASGLDPEARIGLAKLFKTLNREGITILVTSHILAELNEYANQLIVLKSGKIIEDSSSIIKNKIENSRIVIRPLGNPEPLITFLRTLNFTQNPSHENSIIIINFSGSEKDKADLLKHIIQNGFNILEYSTLEMNIQQEYLRIIGER